MAVLLLGACDCGASHTLDASTFVDAPGASCLEERPSPAVGTVPGIPSECATHEECTDGDQGRCVHLNRGTFVCSYDECDRDADCSDGSRCGCAVGPLAQDRCLYDRCEDCGREDCAPSFDCAGPGGSEYSADSFRCHTDSDECLTSADCPANEFCTRSATAGGPELPHWECRPVTCTD